MGDSRGNGWDNGQPLNWRREEEGPYLFIGNHNFGFVLITFAVGWQQQGSLIIL
jgi:hypothetical protein